MDPGRNDHVAAGPTYRIRASDVHLASGTLLVRVDIHVSNYSIAVPSAKDAVEPALRDGRARGGEPMAAIDEVELRVPHAET